MDIVKKNLFSIICGVVALLALAAIFWPIDGMFTDLLAKANDRAGVYASAERLLSETRHLPLIDPAKTEPEALKDFPTEAMVNKARDAQKSIAGQSHALMQSVVDLNRRPQLIDGALPNPQSGTPKFRFADTYKLVMSVLPEDSMANPQSALATLKQPNLRNDILHGAIPPSKELIEKAQKEKWDGSYVSRIIVVNGVAINQAQITADFAGASKLVPDQLRSQVAANSKIYVDPTAFTVNPNLAGIKAPELPDIWTAQVMLWVQQDLCIAIAEANAGAKNVLDAPVKHLLKMAVPYTVTVATGGGPGAPGMLAPAVGLAMNDSAPLEKRPTASASGRVTNPLFDVVNFTLTLNVDARQIPAILQILSRNRLITVNNLSELVTVNTDARKADGFIYGDAPVVQINVSGEYLLMRSWTTELMPGDVRKALNIAPPAAIGLGMGN